MTGDVTNTPDTPEFSVCITCHFEEHSIDEFYQRLSKTLEETGRTYEILMVNDGSTDATWTKLKAIFARDPKVQVIMDLFKNAGQRAALTAAMVRARGRAIVLMDSDLQLMPEDLPALIAEWDTARYDLVSGYRRNRKDSLFRIIPSKLANVIMRRASKSTLTDFGCTFKIYNATLIRALAYGPHHIFNNVDAIAALDRYTEVPVRHRPRPYGKSGWTFSKLWRYNMDNLVLLTQYPFQVLGLGCIVVSMLFLLRIILGFVVEFQVLDTVTNGLLLNAMAFAVLLLLAVLALMGEFTIRCFASLRQIPAYAIRELIARQNEPPA
ncbi:MAG: glycosyltransferase family 2 protein [Candidatus Hydrogenedentota bacterium]